MLEVHVGLPPMAAHPLLGLLGRQVARDEEHHVVHDEERHGQTGHVVLALLDLFLHQLSHLLQPRPVGCAAALRLGRPELVVPQHVRDHECQSEHDLVDNDGYHPHQLRSQGRVAPLEVLGYHQCLQGLPRIDCGEARQVRKEHTQCLGLALPLKPGVELLLHGNLFAFRHPYTGCLCRFFASGALHGTDALNVALSYRRVVVASQRIGVHPNLFVNIFFYADVEPAAAAENA
mmetsp:Transcript_44831/g.125025  ORF Transcript_44831/g.125025 Transcript_44831/m.125025 type:complete len:233 (-) Transcript_44831:356-1054(-)